VIAAAPIIHQRHPEVLIIIAGEKGTYYPVLQSMAKELGAEGYVEFPGIISMERKVELMQRCKVYLQPSRHEGFGLAILEAMSCGAPVVTCPVGAVPEVVGDAGLFAPANSPAEIAGAVTKLLNDPVLRKDLSRRARLRAESVFSFERRKQELGKIIDEVLAGTGD
jgi:glycosyltransferase involved in cell wall biosynthesis